MGTGFLEELTEKQLKEAREYQEKKRTAVMVIMAVLGIAWMLGKIIWPGSNPLPFIVLAEVAVPGFLEGIPDANNRQCAYWRCVTQKPANNWCEDCQIWYCDDHIEHFCNQSLAEELDDDPDYGSGYDPYEEE